MRKIFLLIVGLPLAFTIIFGHVYDSNVVNQIPLTICDEDQTSLSRTLINMYADSEKFSIVSHVATLDDVHAEIFSGHAKAALIIPKNFSREVKLGHGSEISIVVNSANNMFGNAALSAAQELNRTFSIGVAQKLFEGANLLPDAAMATVYPIKMGVRILGNPTNGYSPFMLSGLLLNGLQIGIMLAFVTFLTDELQLRRDFTKIFYVRFIFRRVATIWLFGIIGCVLSLIVAIKFFAIPMRGSWLDVLILSGAFIFFVEGVLMIFSAIAPQAELALQAPMLYIMPGLLYSGLSFPTFDMNEFARLYSSTMPMTYAGDNLRDILLIGHAPNLWQDFRSMLLGGTIGIFIALTIFFLRLKRGGSNVPARN